MSVSSSQINGNFAIAARSLTEGHLSATAAIARTQLALDSLKSYQQKLTDFRIWDAFATVLTATSGTDDLGLYGGTFASASPTVGTGDVKTTTVTRYARIMIPIPMEYEAGEDVNIRLHAGMQTTVADGSATIDVQAYRSDEDAGIGSDLCSTSAQSINSLTSADKDFIIDGATLSPGDWLDVRITIAVVDSATGTAVIAQFGSCQLLVDVRG